MMTDDAQLLRQYTDERVEPAFGELVTRHIDLVFSVALRLVGGDRHLAQDVTQSVFADLARKAGCLQRDVVLAGWLYRHACYTAAKVVRAERRRRIREKAAMEMNSLHDNTEPAWEQIAPVLDEAMSHLSASDRDAIVLRFLKRQDFHAVGSALGVGEDAAQKRVSRAVEKLRTFLSRRGIRLTGTALAVTLTTEAVVAAPAGLAVSVTAASLTAGAATATTLSLLKFMAITKFKTGVIGAIVVASVVTPLVMQHQAQARLRGRDETLRKQTDQLARLQADNEQLSKLLAAAKNLQTLSDDQFRELMRLRGEVGRLRREAQELLQAKTNAPPSRSEMSASMEKIYSERVSQLKQLLETNPSEQIPELQFLSDSDWQMIVEHNALDTEEARRSAMSSARGAATLLFCNANLRPALRQYAEDNNGQFPADLSQLKPYFRSSVDDAVLQRYVILPTSKLPSSLVRHREAGESFVITQKAPVNAALDGRVYYGLKSWTGGHGTNVWGPLP